jgi:putative lipoic acid-binding regulatory protein
LFGHLFVSVLANKGENMGIENINENIENFGEDKKVEFPVSYTMKAIFNSQAGKEVLQRNLELVLEDSNVQYSNFQFRESGKGNYVTVSVDVTLNDEGQFKNFYKQLKLLPNLKWAV